MIPSNATRLNIPVTQSLRSWMEKTGMIGSWSRDPGLVSNQITKIGKIIKRRWMITNVVLPSGWGIAVSLTRVISESRVIERRHTRNKNNMSGPSPPSNHSFIR